MNSISELSVQNASDCWSQLYFALAGSVLKWHGKPGEKFLRETVREYGKKVAVQIKDDLTSEGKLWNLKTLFSSNRCGLADPRIQLECQQLSESVALLNIFSCPFSNMALKSHSEWTGQIFCEEYLHALMDEYSSKTAKTCISDILCNPEDDHSRIAIYLRAANMPIDLRQKCFTAEPGTTISFPVKQLNVTLCTWHANTLINAFLEICTQYLGEESALVVIAQGLKVAASASSEFLKTQAERSGRSPNAEYLKQNSIFSCGELDSTNFSFVALHYTFQPVA